MIGWRRFLALYALLAAAALFLHSYSTIRVPENRPFYKFPADYDGWHMVSQYCLSEAVLEQLKPTDYLERSYISHLGIPVVLYIGYSSGGKGSGPVHSPEHCLPGNGRYKVSEKKITVAVPGGRIPLVDDVYRMGGQKQVFLYCYQMKGGRIVTNDYAREVYEIINSILYRRRDVALIRVSVPVSTDEKTATEAGVRFVRDFYPLIAQFLPR